MSKKLFIPNKIHIGFQTRQDTYTGKLGYVIYEDEKGKLRKEKSWNSWCDDTIEKVSFDNTPQPNFVLNRGIQRGGWDWYSKGRSVIRVYDPRDFEFEISVDNLIGILMHSDVSKRDIVEECVYAWDGAELVLLPTNSQDYQDAIGYTEKQSQKVSAKNLVLGHSYSKKKSDGEYVYLGRYEWFDYSGKWKSGSYISYGKKHVFYHVESKTFDVSGVSTFAACVNEEPHPEFAYFVEDLHKSRHISQVKEFKVVDAVLCDKYMSYYVNMYKIDDGKLHHISFADYNSNDRNIRLNNINFLVANVTTRYIDNDTNATNFDYYENSFQSKFGVSLNKTKSTRGAWGYYSDAGIKINIDTLFEYMREQGFKTTIVAVCENGNEFKWRK